MTDFINETNINFTYKIDLKYTFAILIGSLVISLQINFMFPVFIENTHPINMIYRI